MIKFFIIGILVALMVIYSFVVLKAVNKSISEAALYDELEEKNREILRLNTRVRDLQVRLDLQLEELADLRAKLESEAVEE